MPRHTPSTGRSASSAAAEQGRARRRPGPAGCSVRGSGRSRRTAPARRRRRRPAPARRGRRPRRRPVVRRQHHRPAAGRVTIARTPRGSSAAATCRHTPQRAGSTYAVIPIRRSAVSGPPRTGAGVTAASRTRAGDAAVDDERATAVMNDASSLARNATAAAISSGSANRPIGTCTSRRAARSGSLANSSMQQRRGDRPGAQRVDPDALAGELHAQLAGHRQHPALARGVGDLRGGRAHQRDEARRC